MYVRNKMHKEVFTINQDFKINEALNIMSNHDLHRLPVVSGHKLVGLITAGVISAHTPSKASSLSIHEMNYVLSKMTVKEIMIKDVITIGPDALLEEAAYLMRKNDIGCLPVVDDSYNLVGILTINDIIDSLIDILGYFKAGKRIEIEVSEDSVGVLADIANTFTVCNVSINRLSIIQVDGIFTITVLADDTNTDKVESALTKKGYKITGVYSYNNSNK